MGKAGLAVCKDCLNRLPAQTDNELRNVFPLVHGNIECRLNAFQFGIEQIPNSRFHCVGIAQNKHLHISFLAIAREATDALMQTHRIPRHIDVDQGRTAFLKVYAFTGRFCGNEKADFPCIEIIRRSFPRPAARASAAIGPRQIIEPAVPIDKGAAAKAETVVECIDHQGLCCLVFREEQHRFTLWQLFINEPNQALDLLFVNDRLRQRQQLLQPQDFAIHQFDQQASRRIFVLDRCVVEGLRLIIQGYGCAGTVRYQRQLVATLDQGAPDCGDRACSKLLQCDQQQHSCGARLPGQTEGVGTPIHDEFAQSLVKLRLGLGECIVSGLDCYGGEQALSLQVRNRCLVVADHEIRQRGQLLFDVLVGPETILVQETQKREKAMILAAVRRTSK